MYDTKVLNVSYINIYHTYIITGFEVSIHDVTYNTKLI